MRYVRDEGLAASRGATDFGEYFVYFSFFLVVSALLLSALFFKLGVEQRAREVGLLRAVGFGPTGVRRLFLRRGTRCWPSLAAPWHRRGHRIRVAADDRPATWWVDAVGTTALTLHVSRLRSRPAPRRHRGGGWLHLVDAAQSGRISERSLLLAAADADGFAGADRGRLRRFLLTAVMLSIVGAACWSRARSVRRRRSGRRIFRRGCDAAGASLAIFAVVLRAPVDGLAGRGWWPVSRLGLRNATYRPGRSVLSMAVIACATFILICRRRLSARRRRGHRRSALGHRRIRAARRVAAAGRPRSEHGRRTRGAQSRRSRPVGHVRAVPAASWRRCELSEPVRAEEPADSGAARQLSRRGRFAFQDSLASTDASAPIPGCS